MKILLYGGTFDPPHYGHLNNLRAAASRVQPDEIVVMPAGVSPFKQMSETPGTLRAEMCGCFVEALQGAKAVKTNSRLWSSASSRGRASTGQREIEPIP